MALIVRQTLWLLVAVAAAYGLFLAASLLVVRPAGHADRLDSAKAGETLFMTQPKYVFMSRSRLDTTADKVLLVGASNTLAGFRQEQVQPLLPGVEVHNLSVGGSNMVGSSRVDLQACKLEYSIVSPK